MHICISKQTNEDTLPVHNFNVCFQVVYAFIYLYVVTNFASENESIFISEDKIHTDMALSYEKLRNLSQL